LNKVNVIPIEGGLPFSQMVSSNESNDKQAGTESNSPCL